MNQDVTATLAFATEIWDFACAHPEGVQPTLNLLRRNGPNVVMHVTSEMTLEGARELLDGGIFPIPPPSVDMAQKSFKPLFARLGVYAAQFVCGATLYNPQGERRVLMSWTCQPAQALEVTWCRGVGPDGRLYDVSLEDVGVLGTDWIKAAL